MSCKTCPTKAGVAILSSDKVYIRAKKITRDREGHCMIKRSIHPEDIAILSVCAPNNRDAKYVKKKKNPED